MNQELPDNAIESIDKLLRDFVRSGGFQLDFTFKPEHPSRPAGQATDPPPPPAQIERIVAEFTGPDASLLTVRNGELLHALEHLAAKVLRLESEDHDRISFDAEFYKANRDRDLRRSAAEAIDSVRANSRPFSFSPMTSRERRLLHLALSESGLPTASTGDGPRRFVVLYPEGHQPQAPSPQGADRVERDLPRTSGDRTNAIRSSFRRR